MICVLFCATAVSRTSPVGSNHGVFPETALLISLGFLKGSQHYLFHVSHIAHFNHSILDLGSPECMFVYIINHSEYGVLI